MESVCVGIVTYNPTIELLKKSVDILKMQTNKIIIVDNHSSNIEEIKELDQEHIVLIELDENFGIAYALNYIMDIAEKQGYDYVLSLDQDTVVAKDYIEKIMCFDWDEDIAIVCPSVFDRYRGVQDISGKAISCVQDSSISYVDQCITSGAVTKVKAWKAIDKYDEILFIDNVDFDFCQRLRKNGYRIAKNSSVEINHAIGDGKVYKFFLGEISVHNHNAFRKYYISRNKIYTDYKIHNRIRIKSFASNAKLLIKTILFEDKKYEKTKAIIRGTKDGIKLVRGVK